jgi:hypothetical protein
MEVKFKESNRDNPLNYFEDFFTPSGQFRARIHFLSETLPQVMDVYDPEDGTEMDYGKFSCNLETDVFTNDFGGQDHETGEWISHIIEFRYIDHLRDVLVNPESHKFMELLNQRIDGCNGPEEETYVLNKMLKKISVMETFLEQNNEVPFRDRLRVFVTNLRRRIENLMPDYTSETTRINSEKKKESIGSRITKVTDRLSDLQSHIPLETLMNFLKKEGFIKCSKPEIAKFNYYFGIGKGVNRPSSKIKWLKHPELLKLLIKKGFNGAPKFRTMAKIFEVDGVSEEEIINWANRHVNKKPDKVLRIKLEKFLDKHLTEAKKNTKQNKDSLIVLLS